MSVDIHTIGRRKCSVARLYLREGKHSFDVNNRSLESYFPQATLRQILLEPFRLLKEKEMVDHAIENYTFVIRVSGGGSSGQAEAVRLAISRALVVLSEDNKPPLRKAGLVTRDPRMVERKKYGRRKARRSFQFSKR